MSGSRCEQQARALVGKLYETLRSEGFRKRGAWLRRRRAGDPLGVVHVVGVQVSQGNGGKSCRAVVTVGATPLGLPALPVDTERVRPRDCLWSERIGDHWEIGGDLSDVAYDVGEQLGTWFAARDSVQAMLAPFDDRDPSTIRSWLGQVDVVCAAWVARGDLERARALFDAKRAYVVEHRPKEDPGLIDTFGRKLGLLPSDDL